VADVLAPLAARRAAGESHRVLSRELYERHIHRWGLQRGRALCLGLPAHADRHEVVSQALRLAWDACDRIDWDRIVSWPALLETKMAHARIEAARTDDWLSRRERTYRRRYQAGCAALEQAKGRGLRPDERQEAARAATPAGTRIDWGGALLADRHPSSVADYPEVPADLDVATEVEVRLSRDRNAAGLAQWLELVGRQDPVLAGDLRDWSRSHGDGSSASLPARLAKRMWPYRPTLIALIYG
jgi:hypothetical protein